MAHTFHGTDESEPSSVPFLLDFLTLGHITRDLHTDGSFALGGTATFAALTAYRLGLVPGIVTCASPDILQLLDDMLCGIALAARSTETTTTFVNQYTEDFRTQHLQERAPTLMVEDVPLAWRNAPIVLLGPLAQEVPLEIVQLFRKRPGAIIAATPQGWLRRWDTDGRIWPTPWKLAELVLPLLDVLILSHDDLLPLANGSRYEADAMLTTWSRLVPLLVATDGKRGATLFQNNNVQRFPAYPARELDPTGAGDVFAAAFLTMLYRQGDAAGAVDFANCVASFSIEQEGILGIPTLEHVEERLRKR